MNIAGTGSFINKRKLLVILLGFLVILLVLTLVLTQAKDSSIDSFDECAKAGNPIMDSYPEQCAADSKIFTKPQPPPRFTD